MLRDFFLVATFGVVLWHFVNYTKYTVHSTLEVICHYVVIAVLALGALGGVAIMAYGFIRAW